MNALVRSELLFKSLLNLGIVLTGSIVGISLHYQFNKRRDAWKSKDDDLKTKAKRDFQFLRDDRYLSRQAELRQAEIKRFAGKSDSKS